MLFLLLALFFSPLAAAMAFLTTYHQYRRHFPEGRKALKAALETAVATFIVFMAIFLAAGFFFGRMV
ncbi:MAG: hypothetical protein HYX92_14100 [Chloroflexi bacterium]|nr:hypothetical protein [Chloroflexota bacterium]